MNIAHLHIECLDKFSLVNDVIDNYFVGLFISSNSPDPERCIEIFKSHVPAEPENSLEKTLIRMSAAKDEIIDSGL
jgi:hypothetical protein